FLCDYIFNYCKKLNYSEISLAVLLSNYNAIRLYHRLGFTQLLCVSEDEDGKYIGLLKKLN
ncbi:MAG: GNAT family N-acetyltransferase, partial [Clostridia bacterium]|nr:GNAT family N-acetyltransferase [Clostridia bacterium]